jgi:hypothetical protein
MPYTYQYPRPALTVDCVVFGFDEGELKVLLIQRGLEPFKDKWALPGGFVRVEETIDDAARRELEEEAGLTDVFLEQRMRPKRRLMQPMPAGFLFPASPSSLSIISTSCAWRWPDSKGRCGISRSGSSCCQPNSLWHSYSICMKQFSKPSWTSATFAKRY